MPSIIEIIDGSGLTRLGQAGTAEDVQSAWKSFSSVRAEPVVRISDSLEEVSLALLNQTWRAMADRLGLVSSEGEFLLTVSGEGTFGLSWFHVRVDEGVAVSDLGQYPGEPDFIASSLDRSVNIAVSTEESEFWILVERADT
jgi:hypothetical protein